MIAWAIKNGNKYAQNDTSLTTWGPLSTALFFARKKDALEEIAITYPDYPDAEPIKVEIQEVG